jgi:hypothetical protein
MPKISAGRSSVPVVETTLKMPALDGFVAALHDAHKSEQAAPLIPLIGKDYDAMNKRLLWEDISLLLECGPVVGIRTNWVRRIAQPVYMAHKALQGRASNRFAVAHEIILQCADPEMRRVIQNEITNAERPPEKPGIVQTALGLFKRA